MANRSANMATIICFVVAVLFLVLFVPLKFKTKSTTIEKRLVWNSGFHWDDGFSHEVWDGPTGTFSSGDIYAFKLSPLVWRLDIYTGNP